jgi:hypothetical protein
VSGPLRQALTSSHCAPNVAHAIAMVSHRFRRMVSRW